MLHSECKTIRRNPDGRIIRSREDDYILTSDLFTRDQFILCSAQRSITIAVARLLEINPTDLTDYDHEQNKHWIHPVLANAYLAKFNVDHLAFMALWTHRRTLFDDNCCDAEEELQEQLFTVAPQRIDHFNTIPQ